MNRFLFDQHVNPNFLVFLRAATGLLLSLSILALWPDFSQLYGQNGVVDPALLTLKQGIRFFNIYDIQEYIHQYYHFTEQQIHQVLFITYISLCIFLILGLFTKTTSLILIILHGAIFTAITPFSYGFDYFCTVALFYCFIFPTGHYKSLDQKLFNLKPSMWANPCLRVLQINVSLVYFFSGFDKLLGHTWRNGEALWKTMHLPYFRSAFIEEINTLGAYPWVWVCAGWLIILIELLYPIFIWIPKTRKAYLWLTILLHIQIALFLQLYLFSAIMIALNMAAFYYSIQQKTRPKQPITPLRFKRSRLKPAILYQRNTTKGEK